MSDLGSDRCSVCGHPAWAHSVGACPDVDGGTVEYPCPDCGISISADIDSDAYAGQWCCDDCAHARVVAEDIAARCAHTRYFVASQPNFGTGETEYWLGENVPVHHLGDVIGYHGEYISGPYPSQDSAIDALAEISTPDAVALAEALKNA